MPLGIIIGDSVIAGAVRDRRSISEHDENEEGIKRCEVRVWGLHGAGHAVGAGVLSFFTAGLVPVQATATWRVVQTYWTYNSASYGTYEEARNAKAAALNLKGNASSNLQEKLRCYTKAA